jgi:hypothetical protein
LTQAAKRMGKLLPESPDFGEDLQASAGS